MKESLSRILSGAPVSPGELRLAGLFALIWFVVDMFWFISSLCHWFGL